MSNIALVDNTALGYLSKAYASYGSEGLDTLYSPTYSLAITSTVQLEATGNLGYPKDAAVAQWLNNGIASHQIQVIPTSYAPGRNAGDDSIRAVVPGLSRQYGGVIVITDDGGLRQSLIEGQYGNVVVRDTYSNLFSNFLAGGITYQSYYEVAYGLLDQGQASEGEIVFPGREAYGADGTRLFVSEDGQTITRTDLHNNSQTITAYEKFVITPQCFPAGTAILLAIGGWAAIETIAKGTVVAAFAAGAPSLTPRRVVRVFQGVTETFVRLSNGLVVTPGHHFLDAFGKFRSIADILSSDGHIVLEDGQLAAVSGEYLHYAENTADLFERAQGHATASEGAVALAPTIVEGWRTYNFEVEDLHTYIAGGVRVHNQSVYLASGADIPVGPAVAKNGDPLQVNANGTVTNLRTGYTSPASPYANAKLAFALPGTSPSGQYDAAANGAYAHVQWTGNGPNVTTATGKVIPAGTVFDPGNGYLYAVNGDGSITNLKTGYTSAPGQSSGGSTGGVAGSGSYQIHSGDTLSQIAAGHGTTVAALMQANPSITDPNKIYAGSTIVIPSSGGSGGNGSNSGSSSSTSQTSGGGKASQSGSGPTSGGSSGSSSGQSASGISGSTIGFIGGTWVYQAPVVLDLDGNGISLDPLTSSDTFLDTTGDGLKHRTAWAAAGDGVLVRDAGNDGVIDHDNEIDFTQWDPTAKSDMQALLDVFDTNHNGKLDSGDTDWSLFKVMVTNADGTRTLQTLSALGITSIDLISNNQRTVETDGSTIVGTSKFTKSDGSTGKAGDAKLASDANGYVVVQTVTHNGDGSTTVENRATDASGNLVNDTVVTTSADGLTRTSKFDDDGDGVFDRVQIQTKVVNGDGSVTVTLSSYDGSGTILLSKQVTSTSSDLKTITISRDLDGSGNYDVVETRVTGSDGSLTVTTTDLNADGSRKDRVTTTTSADGLSRSVQTEFTGSGAINETDVTTTTVGGDGTRTETLTVYHGSGTSSANKAGQKVTTRSADGSTQTVATDLDGNGTTDVTTASTIVRNADASTTTTQTVTNGDSSLRTKAVTDRSSDGYTETVRTDLDGDGSYDQVRSDVTTVVSGTTTETVTDTSGNGTLLDKTVTSYSADGKTRSTSVDSDGDGAYDQVETVAVVSGNSVDTSSIYSPNGVTLVAKTVTTTSGDGLTQTVQADVNGDGTYDKTETVSTVINGDGSSTVTDVVKNGAGTVEIGRTVTTTSANGLSRTTQFYVDGQASPYRTVTDVTVKNADGSLTRTVTEKDASSLVVAGSTVTLTSADRLTTTSKQFVGTNANPAAIVVATTAADGTKTVTQSAYSPDGATLIGRTVTVTSPDGLTVTTTTDTDGNSVTDGTQIAVKTLNSDGTTTLTATAYAGSGTGTSNKVGQSVVSTSVNGLSVTTQVDANGDGVFDAKSTDVTTINTDGSTTETATTFNGDGSVQTGRTATTVSGDRLSRTKQTYIGAHTSVDQTVTDVTTLGADGSQVETVTTKSGSGATIGKSVTTAAGNGLTKSVATDLDGNGINDVTVAGSTNADGSTATVTSTFSATGILTSRSTVTTSASGLSTTTTTDLDGNGTTDLSQTEVTVVNADGSTTETLSDFTATGALRDKIVVTKTADGLSTTTQWDGTGAGSFSRTATDVTTYNGDGSKTRVVSNLNPNGSLHNRTTTTTTADGLSTTTNIDLNGDGTTDQTIVQKRNADGTTTESHMDGTVLSASGRLYGSVRGAYETDSANGLSKTVQYDANGDSLAESQTTDVLVLNADGSKVETIADAALSGGTAGSANPVYTVTPKDKAVITTSKDALLVTTQWDLTGSGTFTESETDQTALNTDGSKTETTSVYAGATLKSRIAVTTSADGLTQTSQWDPTGSGTYSSSASDVTTVNADGTRTETVTATASGGALIAKTVTTTSADGRTITVQQDPGGTGSFTQSKTIVGQTLADGTTIQTVSDFTGGGVLKDKTTVQTSGDGLTVTTNVDANGDGINDQTSVVANSVDGSSTITSTDFGPTGTMIDKTITTVSWDGLTTTTQRWLDGDGIMDRTATETKAFRADGSSVDTLQVYRTSQQVSGVWQSISPVLMETVTQTVSADGKTRTTTTDVDGNGSTDETSTAVTKVDGSVATTTTDNTAARSAGTILGSVVWTSAIATSNKTVPAISVATTSVDGLSTTIQSDYDGNGTYEHTETWQTKIDGSRTASITDKNASSVVVAKGTETISADGLTTTLLVDGQNDGIYEHKEVSVRRPDGSIDLTVSELNTDGSLKSSVESFISPAAQVMYYKITGTPSADSLTGGDGNDTLDGRGGADTMVGGKGNDTYVVDNAGDVVTENANEGIDTVQSSIAYTLGSNVENLTLTGSSAINGTGNTLDNVLVGNSANNTLTGGAGNDTLDGGAGADTLVGGTGNDTYVVDNVGDVVTENSAEGTDTVQSSISYTLGSNVENLTLVGSAAVNATGNSLNNILQGNNAANTLNGGSGADTMSGGDGNDIYVVDNSGDVVTELANQGIDTVQSSLTYTLGANVENLTLTGSSALNGTGNSLANVIQGNSAANTLLGMDGDDTLIGGGGADVLNGGNGFDTVSYQTATSAIYFDTSAAASTYTGDAHGDTFSSIEAFRGSNYDDNMNVTIDGATLYGGLGNDFLNGTGNGFQEYGEDGNDTLWGSDGVDHLDGGTGDDTILGYAGDDLILGGDGDDVLGGDDGNDTMYGGAGSDWVEGDAGNDTLYGEDGNDYMEGGSGADSFNGGNGWDTVTYEHSSSGVHIDTAQSPSTFTGDATGDTFSSIEQIVGTSADDYLSFSNGEVDTIHAGAGNDYLHATASSTTLYGEDGNDTIDGGSGADDVLGGNGNDVINTFAGDDAVDGDAGDDTIYGGDGNDWLSGDDGNDYLDGGNGDDYLAGGNGADSFNGGAGYDTVTYENATAAVHVDTSQSPSTYTGEATGDTFSSIEQIVGSAYGDYLSFGNGVVDTISAGAGNDYLHATASSTWLYGGDGNDTIDGGSGSDDVEGGNGNDVINGFAGVDLIDGNDGDDIINGGDGDDSWLSGDNGNDTLNGGAGNDYLAGGAGVDTFVFDPAFGHDIISDYTATGTSADQISINHTVFADWAHLLAASTQSGSDVLITANTNDSILLKNTTLASLQQSNFHFA